MFYGVTVWRGGGNNTITFSLSDSLETGIGGSNYLTLKVTFSV